MMADIDPASTARQSSKPSDYLALKSEHPEKILIINCGSSSLKFSFYDTADASRQAGGLVERIGAEGTRLKYRGPHGEITRDLPRGGFDEAVRIIMATLTSQEEGVFVGEVTLIAHRVVHGGEKFTQGTLITEQVLAQIEALGPLAPLHNPVNLAGIRALRKLFPSVPQVAVFDTAFHHTLPPHAYLYGLPYEFYESQRIRRYGFHGTSHHYVSLRAPQLLKRQLQELRVVSCHLGNGASICAIEHGRSVDTSMGFTPLEGLIMGTRSGDIDPGIFAYLERTENLNANRIETILNTQSGLLGISGVSNDMRELLQAANTGHLRAILALETYGYRIRKYIGAYIAAMGGVDAVVFTGGIGEGSPEVRALALQGLECMGVLLDNEQNRAPCEPHAARHISALDSKVAVLVIPADEERMIAREALDTLNRPAISQPPEA